MKNFSLKLTSVAVMLATGATFAIAATSEAVEDANTWKASGENALRHSKNTYAKAPRARNIILFVGDGMGISTITGSRIFEGQQKGIDGEKNKLAFEELPYVALSKTYSTNQQTPDSAPTMTAMVTGIKTNDGEISINQSVDRGEKSKAVILANRVTTILQDAELRGLSTGIISTARITHATPAATYAHISDRNWESSVPADSDAKDIAQQLIENFGANGYGDGIDVVLGGGRAYFTPNTMQDPEYPSRVGRRADDRDLTKEYQTKFGGQYIWNKTQFDAIDPTKTKKLLGLFEPSHMQYEQDRSEDAAGEPSLAEMTSKAIDILKNNNRGYFLMVEAGRIDHASHAGNAYRTFKDTVALSDAVRETMKKVNMNETLIIVTADHSHTLTIAGYPKRGNPILGTVVAPGKSSPTLAADGNPYTTVSFANGLGYHVGVPGDAVYAENVNTGRVEDMSTVDTTDPDFHQEALVPLSSETHSGEDVAIYAGGPSADLFKGVQEQSYIYYVMKNAFGFKNWWKTVKLD